MEQIKNNIKSYRTWEKYLLRWKIQTCMSSLASVHNILCHKNQPHTHSLHQAGQKKDKQSLGIFIKEWYCGFGQIKTEKETD